MREDMTRYNRTLNVTIQTPYFLHVYAHKKLVTK